VVWLALGFFLWREVSGEELDVWRAGRVVRHDGLDDAVGLVLEKLVPEPVLVRLRADGRAALVACVAFLDAFGGQGEVVETGFGGDLDALGAGFAEHGDGFDGGEVDDVELQFGSEVR
jgi:hypothetical protein